MKVKFRQLESFVWVADLGSFRMAEERLNTTQPNISSRIAALEESLGVVLMQRDAGSVRLTRVGTELLDKARMVIKSAENFVSAAGNQELHEGSLRVGVTEMVANTWLNSFLTSFKQQYPNVLLELSVDLAANLEQELSDTSIDLSFQSGPFVRSISNDLPLGSFPMVLVASPSSILASQQRLTATDLVKEPIITHAKNTIAYKEVQAHLTDNKAIPARLVASSNLMVAVQMVKDGYGTGVLLKPLVADQLKHGNLVEIDYHWCPNDLAFFARYDANRSSQLLKDAAKLAQKLSMTEAKKYN